MEQEIIVPQLPLIKMDPIEIPTVIAHIIKAVMVRFASISHALYLYLKNNNTPDAIKITAGKDFLNEFFENLEAPINKKNVNLSYQIDYNPGWLGATWNFSFKIGLDRLICSKKYKEFIECLINAGKIDFGKKFSFNSRIHSFSDSDRNVIDFFLQLYSAENAFKGDYYSGSGGIFNGKSIRLNENLFIKLCSYMKNRRV